MSKFNAKELFDITDKVIIVTGATGALGEAIARGYAQAGAKVVLTARSEGKLQTLEEEIKEYNDTVSYFVADPAVEENVKDLIAYTVETYGEINALCACHGYNVAKSVLEQSVQEWATIIEANLTSVYILSKYVSEQMIEQGTGGKIVLTSSARSKRGMKGYTGYSTAKAGVDLMAQSLGCDLGEYNIQVNTFNPTVFRSNLTEWMWEDEEVYKNFLKRLPINRLGEPDDFVGMAIFLASDASNFFTSSNYAADGGYWGN